MTDVSMADPTGIERIKTIIEAKRQTHEQLALRQMLLTDQHDPHSVDLALAQVFGLKVDAPTKVPASSSTTRIILLAIGTFFANAIILISLITAFAMLFSLVESFDGTLIAFASPIVALVAAEAGLVLYLRRHQSAYTRGIAWGLGLTVSAVLILVGLFIGLLALLSNTNFN
jgi:hypothetical protein